MKFVFLLVITAIFAASSLIYITAENEVISVNQSSSDRLLNLGTFNISTQSYSNTVTLDLSKIG